MHRSSTSLPIIIICPAQNPSVVCWIGQSPGLIFGGLRYINIIESFLVQFGKPTLVDVQFRSLDRL
jgi:hypothetical protein